MRLWQPLPGVVEAVFRGHHGPVLSAAMGVDGPQVLSAGADGTLRVWRSDTLPYQCEQYGRSEQSGRADLRFESGHTGPALRCVLTTDCLRAISIGRDGYVHVFRLVSGHEAAVNDVAVSNDGAKVVTCSGDKTVRVWDANSGTQLIVLATHAQEVLRLSRSPVLAAEHAGERAYSRGGREVRFNGDRRLVIATAARDCACHVLECNLGATLQTYGGIPREGWEAADAVAGDAGLASHRDRVEAVVFSPCGLLVATGSHDKTVKVWSVGSGGLLRTCVGHRGDVTAVCFTKDSASLLSTSTDHSCCVWDVESGALVASLSGHTKPVRCVSYSPESDRAATGANDKTLRLWNLRTAGNNIALRGHTASVCAVAISPDARAIFSGGRDRVLVFWGVDESEESGGPWEVTEGYARMQPMRRLVKKPLPGSAVTSLSVASNHLYVAIGYADGVLELIRCESSAVDHACLAHPHASDGEGGGVVSVAFNRDATRLASCGGDRVVLLFSLLYNSDSPRSRQLHGKSAGLCHTLRLDHTLALWSSPQQGLRDVVWDVPGDQVMLRLCVVHLST